MPDYEPIHHTIVAIDIVGSGRLDDRQLLSVRRELREIVFAALTAQSLDVDAIHHNDLGDGMRLIVPAAISPRVLLDPFIPALARALRSRDPVTAVPLRLRTSVHIGLLHRDGGTWAGEPLVHCARLLDAQPVRDAIRLNTGAGLILVVSQAMHDAVVRHGLGLERGGYHEITVREKETTAAAWLCLPGWPDPVWPEAADGWRSPAGLALARASDPVDWTPPDSAQVSIPEVPLQVNVAGDNGTVFAVQGGAQIVHRCT